MEEEDQPIQLLKLNKDTKIKELNAMKLEKILLSDSIKNNFISVISFVGEMNNEKVNILNLMLRYLYAKYVQNDMSLLENSQHSFKELKINSEDLETDISGTWIWSKIFINILPNGEKNGIILMNTENDTQSISLSTMLSSLQIQNLCNDNKKKIDLKYLELFSEYAQMCNYYMKPFHKLLHFVNKSPNKLNFKPKHLNFDITEDTDQNNLLYLKYFYENIDSYQIPDILYNKLSNSEYKDLDSELSNALNEMLTNIFQIENIETKQIRGHKMKAKDFYDYVNSCWNILIKETILPTAQQIFDVSSDAVYTISLEQALDYYNNEMFQQVIKNNDIFSLDTLHEVHQNSRDTTLKNFDSDVFGIGDCNLLIYHSGELYKTLEFLFVDYIKKNEEKYT